MCKTPSPATNWFLIACSMILTIIPLPPVHAAEPATTDSGAAVSHLFERLSNSPLVESVGLLTAVEDPPDLVRTAIVPRDGGGNSASYTLPGGNGGFVPPVQYQNPQSHGVPQYGVPQYGNPNGYGPAAPYNVNYGGQNSTVPFNGNTGGYAPSAPFNGYQPPQPYQVPAQFQEPAKPSDSELHDAKVTARYQDPTYLTFLSRASISQLTALYVEASQLIDTRHVSPTSYEVRTQAAVRGLIAAMNNAAFQQANGVSPRADQVQAFQNDLSQIMNAQGPRTANEAVGIMQWVGETANRRLGLRREVVAMEFLNETLDSLDKYSSFMPNKTAQAPSAALEMSAALEESIVGIGVELKTHAQGALIMGVIEGGPSAESGMRKGDILVSVNGQELAGMPLSQVADRITGRSGTQVVINVRRNGQRLGATLVRRSVYVGSVTGTQMIEGSQVGYIRLKQFSDSSTKDLEAAMTRLHNSGMKSLVLDLRGNPGGLLTQSVSVSDLFLTQGTIVATKGRTASDNSSESARFERTWSTPLVVLVDDNSASASEILAAAIQDNRRGVIVGRKSYGKGTVQTHFPLKSTNGTLKLTTAKFYAPSGREMAGQGVTPDYPVQQPNMDSATTLLEDADVRMAMQVIQSGVVGQMAQGATAGQPTGLSQITQPFTGLRDYLWNNPAR